MKNKKLLTGMLATVLSVCMICSNMSITQAQETNDAVIANDETGIPDTNLYNAILVEADSNKDGVLTIAEAESVWTLSAKEAGIEDLTGIEYCKNICNLYLSNNEIRDISNLNYLTGDHSFDIRLSNNQITKVDGLSNLTNVWKLDLSNNQINDISGLRNLMEVEDFLYLSNNQLTNIDVLSNLKSVCTLKLNNNQISNINGLGSLTYVEGCLDLSNNQIRDISILDVLKENGCEIITDGNPIGEPEEDTPNGDVIIPNDETGIPDANLYHAILNGMISNGNGHKSGVDSNKDGLLSVAEAERVSRVSSNKVIKDLQGIEYCKNLESLNLGSRDEEGEIRDISPLAGMKSLQELYLINHQISDISALAGKNLWCLDLSYNPLGENAIDVISNIVCIEEIYLAGTGLTNEDVEKLANLDRLAGFDFSDNQISDISSLDNIWKYVYLIDLSNNQISDVSVLKGLGGAGARFYLSNNQISDVTPFADSNIHTLDLSNNQISDFTGALGRMYLNLSHNQISDITPLLTCYFGNEIDLSNNQIADITPLKDLKENEDWGEIIIWTVNLSNNKITDITPITTNDFFTENTGILNLSNNKISDITSFANISRDTSLCKLDLSNNNIRDISDLDVLKEKEEPCEIITDGNPIGEPEEDTPNGDVIIPNDETGIPDENLYQAILEDADSNEDGILTVAEAETVYDLTAENAGIKDLTGIQYCKNIGKEAEELTGFVYLSGNQITDISPLSFLKGDVITELDLSNNQLTNVDGLQNLTSVNQLNLSNNQLTNIDGLSNLTSVRILDLSDNQLTNVNGLSNLENGYMVVLSNNQISDISGLHKLKGENLVLSLDNNQLTNVDGLSSVTYAWKLDLSNNKISNLSGLSNLESIGDWFNLENNQLTNVNGLSSLKKVGGIYLNLSNNQISDVSGFHPELYIEVSLLLANNKIQDVTPLANLEIMYKLDLSNNNIRDISPLDTLKEKIETCEIITDGNPIGEPEVPSEPEQPIYKADDFAALIGTQDVVVKPNDYVTITFAQGSKLNDTTGKTEYDFTTTVTTEFANAKLPAFIKENSFITKVSYSYSGVLPASASIQIFVGADYAGKEVFYFLLNDDNTYNSGEVQKVAVNESGYITVTQEHCSDYVVTMENPADLYEEYEESQKTETDDNTNNSTDGSVNQGGQDDNSSMNNENQGAAEGSEENDNQNGTNNESPKTGDYARIGMLSILMLASILLVLRVKGYKRA